MGRTRYHKWRSYDDLDDDLDDDDNDDDNYSSSLSLKCALRESGCRIGYERTKMSLDHFWRSISRDTNVEVHDDNDDDFGDVD